MQPIEDPRTNDTLAALPAGGGEETTTAMKRKDPPPPESMTEGPPLKLPTESPRPTTDSTFVPPQLLPLQETLGDQHLSSALLNAAKDLCATATAAADAENDLDDSYSVDWKLVSPGSLCTAKWWKYYKRFNSFHHSNMKNQAACILCFAQRQFVRGTISTKGGGTGGLSRHLSNHHIDEYELLEGMKEKTMKDKTDACTNNPGGTILAYYKPKPSEMSLLEMKSLYVTAAASWAVTHGIPWTMFSSPTFRNLFLPLNSKALQIVNVDGPKIRQQVMKLGKYAEEAIECELKGKRLAWTSDHWTGPNDETYTTVTAHYMSDNWEMKSACLDFKVFHGSTTGANIYEDIMSVLEKYKGETTMVMDTVGVTDTTGNMGKLGQFLRNNGHEHAYCTDHNFHLNAKLAFERK